MKLSFKIICLTLSVLIFSGCRKEIQKPEWETQILTPLVKTSLGLNDILTDSKFKLNSDSSVVFAFQQKLDSFSLNVLDTFTTSPFLKNVKLSNLSLISDTIVNKVTLGQLARQMMNSSDLRERISGQLILLSHGKTISIEDMNNLSAGPIPLDINQWFQNATLLTGNLQIRLINDLPVDLTNINFELNNKSVKPANIAAITFVNVLSGTSDVKEAVLDGKTVEGDLLVSIPDIDISGKNGVLIDTTDALIIEASIRNITVLEATAIFPAQNVVEDRVEVPLGNTDGLELKETILKTAKVTIEVFSTLEDTLYFTYKLPNATSPTGQSFSVEEFVPPTNDPSKPAVYVYDFDGWKLDLRGAPGRDTVNTFFSDLTGRIKQSSKPVHLSLSDSLNIRITMNQIRPQFIKGYIERDTIIKGENALELFNTIKGQSLNFEKADISLAIENGFGIAADILTKSITSKNDKGDVVNLEDPSLINVAKEIKPAIENPFLPVRTSIGTDKASPLISIFPNSFSYEFVVHAGAFIGEEKQYNNFAFENSYFKPMLDITIPLSLSAKDIILSDTVPITPDFSSSIKNGQITILAENGFPLKVGLTLEFLNGQGAVIETMTSPSSIEEATIDPAKEKVTIKKNSKITYDLGETRLQNIQLAESLIFKINFDTKPEGKFVKLYSDYSIDFKIVGDVKYRVQ